MGILCFSPSCFPFKAKESTWVVSPSALRVVGTWTLQVEDGLASAEVTLKIILREYVSLRALVFWKPRLAATPFRNGRGCAYTWNGALLI